MFLITYEELNRDGKGKAVPVYVVKEHTGSVTAAPLILTLS